MKYNNNFKFQISNFKFQIQFIGNWIFEIGTYWKFSGGFTLIELLVSISLIALLSTIGVSGFQAITRSGRDALRKTDLEQIRSALEIYKSEFGNYPDVTGPCTAGLSSTYVNPYPQDPKFPASQYCYIKDTALTYRLCASLETGGTDDLCGGTSACTGPCNYEIVNP